MLVDMKAHFRIAAAALLLPLLAACAQVSDSPGGTPATGAGTAPPDTAIELTITLLESPDAQPHEFRLVAEVPDTGTPTPDPASTLPDSAAALATVLDNDGEILFPVPDPRRMCTEQYGGPQTAQVSGWYLGRAVDTGFKRTNGCEIARWQAAAALLGGLGGGTGAS